MDFNLSYITVLNDIFTNTFEKDYRALRKSGKPKLIKYSESVFRRWFYSALFEETILSPANLVDGINRKYGQPHLTVPALIPVSNSMYKGFSCKLNAYPIHNHPVTHDLEIILNKCPRIMTIRKDGRLSEELEDAILPSLSIYDPFYIQFLVAVAMELKLLEKMPAIYTNVIRLVNREDFFKLTKTEQFDKIVGASVSIATDKLNNLLPTERMLFNKKIVRDFLINPLTIDEIFQEVYSELGIILEEIWDLDLEELDELDNMVLSSTYILGIVIDKWFLTPFGHYLKLIRPLYILPYKFSEELALICEETLQKNDDIITTLYAPCSNYSVTDLGAEYFNITLNSKNNRYITDSIPIENIINTIINNLQNDNLKMEFLPTEASKTIFEVKIKMLKNRAYWKVMEILSTSTLHDLHIEICKNFDLSFENNYSFFLDQTKNPFTEYTSPEKKKNLLKKADRAFIEELNIQLKQKLIYIVDYDDLKFEPLAEFLGSQGFELEIIGTKKAGAGVIYPRVSKISKYFKDLEEGTLFF